MKNSTFISYAQNYEDVMLWKALGHIEKGFYVDVGAAWTDKDSVTKAFYDEGWAGINIEPNSQLIKLYEKERPRDINLGIAVSDKPSIKTMTNVDDTELSTLDKSNHVIQTDIANGYRFHPEEVSARRLDEILDEYIGEKENREIHFLKVDVEGLEASVLRSNDWTKYRPWVLVINATQPMVQVENYQEWEDIILAADYNYVYCDGVNRYYVSTEHHNLAASFKFPPNYFDRFITYQEYEKNNKIDLLQTQLNERDQLLAESKKTLSEMTKELDLALARLGLSEQNAKELSDILEALANSRFWKFTAPIRKCLVNAKRIYRFIVHFDKQKSPIIFLHWLLRFFNNHPKLKNIFVKIITFLGLKHYLGQIKNKTIYQFNMMGTGNNNMLSIKEQIILQRMKKYK